MRILLCSEFYAPSCGGVQKVIQEIAEHLVKKRHDVTVATSKLHQRQFKELNGVKIKEFEISGNIVSGIKGDAGTYHNFILTGNFDVLLVKAAQQWTFDALWPILDRIRCRKVHIPCGYSCLYEKNYKTYYKQMPDILRKFDHLIYYAEDYRDINFAKQYGIENYSIIPNGAGKEEFSKAPGLDIRKKYGIGPTDFLFLTVGSPPASKGHFELAEAYLLLKLPFGSALILNGEYPNTALRILSLSGMKLIIKNIIKKIIGKRANDSGRLKNLYRSINADSNKKLLIIDMPREEVVSAFFESDLFVFASHVEYSPLVLFEASAAGLAFLTVPVGNSQEIIQWTQGGQICPAVKNENGCTRVSPQVLAKEMEALAMNRPKLKVLGTAGRKNWSLNFSWDQIADRYEQVLMGKV